MPCSVPVLPNRAADAQTRCPSNCEHFRAAKDSWREYERICTEILTYVFTPDLSVPDIQTRSDDGLDIIDAIFPIRSNAPPWALVRSEFRTRFVDAELKNYCDAIERPWRGDL